MLLLKMLIHKNKEVDMEIKRNEYLEQLKIRKDNG